MKNNFWGLIWSSFLETQGLALGILGFLGSFALIRYPFNTSIPLDLVIIVSFFTLLFIATLLTAVNTLLRQNRKLESDINQLQEVNQNLEIENKQRITPKILVAKKETNYILCLLEASELFSQGIGISVYYSNEDEIEMLIGVGYVKTIQSDKKIQAVIDQPQLPYQDILDRLVNNDQKIVPKITIKPSIPKIFISP